MRLVQKMEIKGGLGKDLKREVHDIQDTKTQVYATLLLLNGSQKDFRTKHLVPTDMTTQSPPSRRP